MKLKNVVCVALLVAGSLAVGYTAGKIKSAQEAKEKLFDTLVTMSKGREMSDEQAMKMTMDLREVSEFMWGKVLSDTNKINDQDLAVLASGQALQVALTMGMISETDLFKTTVKNAGKENAPDPEKISETMGTIAGFLMASADPQMWEHKMGK